MEILKSILGVIAGISKFIWLAFWIKFSGMKRTSVYACPRCGLNGDCMTFKFPKAGMRVASATAICFQCGSKLEPMIHEFNRFGYRKLYRHPRPGLMLGTTGKTKGKSQ